MRLSDIAARLDCTLEGDATIDIARVASIEDAGPGDLTFVANAKYQAHLATTRASAVIVSQAQPIDPARGLAVLRSRHPYLSFAQALHLMATTTRPTPGVDRLAAVAADATLGADVSIGPFVVIGAAASIGARTVIYPNAVIGSGVRVGDDCLIHAGASLRDRIVIGNRVIVHDGVVIGADGFGFVRQPDGTHFKIPQLAAVVIEDDVEIGANTTIDRPAVGETRIHAGTKIDNLVQIAHGVRIGYRSLLAAQVGIAGSTAVEDDVTLGGQVGVNGHIRVGKGAVASGKTGITGDIDAGVFVSGYPAVPNLEWRKTQVLLRRLPEFKKRMRELERRLADLERQLADSRKPRDE